MGKIELIKINSIFWIWLKTIGFIICCEIVDDDDDDDVGNVWFVDEC